jgi:mono/diheme cytochrome c family protein
MEIRLTSRTVVLTLLLACGGCEDSMRDQARIKPHEESKFFEDRHSARTPPPGTIARGQLRENTEYFSARNAAGFLPHVPVNITRDLILRGQERFNIYCSVCHGADGYGKGMIVERGFTPPESYHTERLRSMPDGYFYDIITQGKGAMYSYASRVTPDDRWAIVAYIRALQLSQHASLKDVPEAEKERLLKVKND